MRPVAALVAITLMLLVGPLTGGAVAAPDPAGVALTPGADAGRLRLVLSELTPRIVTSTGPATLSVAGTLTNTGDAPVDDVVIRVQRGDPLTTEGEIRDAIDGSAGTDAVTPQFVPLAGELAPGEQIAVRLAVPLRGDPEAGLALGAPGVHELLVNVNGVPREGDRARLAAVRLLLPVVSLPGEPAGDPADGALPFSLVLPVVDTPRRLSTVPGEPILLTDDDLAASLAPDGRLGGLVAALTALAPAGSRLRTATCLAVDPDLVETVSAMRAGYQVRGPDGVPVPGAGAEVATRWLDGLSTVARSGCVIGLPYADADLVALTRGGLGELASAAVTDGREVLTGVLQTTVVAGATWPAAGLADRPTLDRVLDAGTRSLLLSADGVEQGRSERITGVVPIEGGATPQSAVLTDPLLTVAATGPTAAVRPDVGRGGAATAGSPTVTGGPLSTQDAIAALAFRSQDPDAATEGGGPLVLAPQHGWTADEAGARALLEGIDQLMDESRVVARPLDAVLEAGPPAGATAVPAVYPLDAAAREVPGAVVATVGSTSAAVTDLRSAAVEGSGVGVAPDEVFTPLRRGLVRPVSAAWRGRPEPAAVAAGIAAARVADLRSAVRVLEPPGPYSLGTSNAPILITVANGLPITVEVQVEIAPSSGLRVAPIEAQQVPPLGRRQIRASAEVTRSGQFTVLASVRTPDGELLGPPSRLRVRSTAYGTITVWLTGSAGVLLVVLAFRRVLRRVRAGRGQEPAHPATGAPPRDLPEAAHQVLPEAEAPTRVLPEGATQVLPGRLPPLPVARDHPRAGDPFPDPHAPTEQLPAARTPRDGPPRPPGPPPRVPSP